MNYAIDNNAIQTEAVDTKRHPMVNNPQVKWVSASDPRHGYGDQIIVCLN